MLVFPAARGSTHGAARLKEFPDQLEAECADAPGRGGRQPLHVRLFCSWTPSVTRTGDTLTRHTLAGARHSTTLHSKRGQDTEHLDARTREQHLPLTRKAYDKRKKCTAHKSYLLFSPSLTMLFTQTTPLNRPGCSSYTSAKC